MLESSFSIANQTLDAELTRPETRMMIYLLPPTATIFFLRDAAGGPSALCLPSADEELQARSAAHRC